MATQYFRVTAYYPKEDLSVIMDSNGMFEKLWQFSSFLMQKGMQIIEVSTDEKFLDGNITKAEADKDRLILRVYAKGKVQPFAFEQDGVNYMTIQVGNKRYIPDREKLGGTL